MAGIASSEQRYQALFYRQHREVYAYCRRRTIAHTAGDVAAETFLVAWRRVDDVPDGGAALGWLYGVASAMAGHRASANENHPIWGGARRFTLRSHAKGDVS